jgi:CRISPR type I-E-associated protein CasB/Cse2
MQQTEFGSTLLMRLAKLPSSDLSRLRRAAQKPAQDIRILDILAKIHYDMPEWKAEQVDLIAYFYAIAYQCPHSNNPDFNLGNVLKQNAWSETRMRSILDTGIENLSFRFRQVFRYLNAKGTPLNWNILITEIMAWDSPSKWVQRRWAEGFFAPDLDEVDKSNQTTDENKE